MHLALLVQFKASTSFLAAELFMDYPVCFLMWNTYNKISLALHTAELTVKKQQAAQKEHP